MLPQCRNALVKVQTQSNDKLNYLTPLELTQSPSPFLGTTIGKSWAPHPTPLYQRQLINRIQFNTYNNFDYSNVLLSTRATSGCRIRNDGNIWFFNEGGWEMSNAMSNLQYIATNYPLYFNIHWQSQSPLEHTCTFGLNSLLRDDEWVVHITKYLYLVAVIVLSREGSRVPVVS